MADNVRVVEPVRLKMQVTGIPRADDDAVIAAGSIAESRFLVLYGRDGLLTAELAVNAPR